MLMKIKSKSYTISLLLLATFSFAQTGIGTSSPDASAKLDVYSTNKGFLPPRVTLTASIDATTIPSPAEGLLVYNLGSVGLQAGYYYWNGANWATIATASSPDQTVDYIQASLSANQTLSAAGNINFNTSSGAGITITSGGFNLIANKTYKLEAALGGSSTGYGYYAWVDNANTILPGGSIGVVMKAGTSYTDAPQDKAVVYYTPTANTTVYLRVINILGNITAFAPSAASGYSSSWASVQQVGSSAFVNPWVLSGNNVYNTNGNIGIGTSTPNASAILDISSSSKGVLPPKIVLTGRNGTSSPIASPTAGLFVYNTAEAGTASNSVSPGFYFYNGTNWTRMDPEDWATPVSITIDAVTTAPTKGTIVYDKVSYRRTSTTSYEVTYNYAQSTVGTAGNGHYLFRLPGNLTFGSSVLKTTSSSYETIVNRAIIGNGYYGDTAGRLRQIGIIPYDNNRFRIMVMDNTSSGLIVRSSDLGLNTDGASYKFSFILETN
jgi:hypothetical protein